MSTWSQQCNESPKFADHHLKIFILVFAGFKWNLFWYFPSDKRWDRKYSERRASLCTSLECVHRNLLFMQVIHEESRHLSWWLGSTELGDRASVTPADGYEMSPTNYLGEYPAVHGPDLVLYEQNFGPGSLLRSSIANNFCRSLSG